MTIVYQGIYHGIYKYIRDHLGCYLINIKGMGLFPRASERRVLPIVGVCQISSHLHIFSA